jgi:hypothetical protein
LCRMQKKRNNDSLGGIVKSCKKDLVLPFYLLDL